ncbi:hypothetical protein Scep_000750 [Stephania cephalantha]|uniref:Sulfite exporter TauE/SafE family protein 3-like n=1 Tax=Stephania cephalantha TaxID=152367 RepID=A0AAP0LAF6_9MAGN
MERNKERTLFLPLSMARVKKKQRLVVVVATWVVVCWGLVMVSQVGRAERLLRSPALEDEQGLSEKGMGDDEALFHRFVGFVKRLSKVSAQHRTWPAMEFGWKFVIGTTIGFFGAAFGSIGGVGGGGIFVPMLTLIIGFDPKSSTAISKCMIMGAAGSTVYYNLRLRHPTKDLPIIDYDLALLFQPMLILGISIGVAFNVIFAEWMVTVLLILLFLYTSTKALLKGIETWKKETIMKKEAAKLLESTQTEERGDEYRPLRNEPSAMLRDDEVTIVENIYWKEFSLLVFVWIAFVVVQVIKTYAVTCSVEYWILNILQVPIAVSVSLYEAICLYKGKRVIASIGKETSNWKAHQLVFYCFCGILAGIVGGLLGLGGGFILGPLFLELGVPPQVASATSTFAMAFSSSMSVLQYYLLKRFPVPYAVYFLLVATVAALTGQHIVRKLIMLLGRASLIIFILGLTILVSAISLGGTGIVDTIKNLEHNEYMGFENMCS